MKKILIVSDTHRSTYNFEKVIEREKPIQMLIHLGDVEGDEEYIGILSECPVHMVAGNNDFFSDLEKEEEFMVGDLRFFITHGHQYYISMGPERLIEEAYARGVDVAMFGHTHRPYLDETDDLIVLNPGSLSYPRQEGRKPSYMVMEIEEKNKLKITTKYLD